MNNKIASYLLVFVFIVSLFISSKVNMKSGYLLLIVAFFYIYKNQKIFFKNPFIIYGAFIVFFFIGIFQNFFTSNINGIGKFIGQNGNFIYALALSIIFYKDIKNLYFVAVCLFCGVNIESILYLFTNFSLFSNNDLGIIRAMLFLGFVFELILIIELSLKNAKYLYLSIFLILPLFAIIKSNSRMSILSIVIVFSIYAIYKIFSLRQKKYIFLILFSAVFISFFIMPQQYKNHLLTSFDFKTNNSNINRLIMMKAGADIISKNPIFGVGSDQEKLRRLVNTYVISHDFKQSQKDEFLYHSNYALLHNIYLDFFVQNGILGGLFYVVFLWIILPFYFLKNATSCIKVASIFSIIAFNIYGFTWSLWHSFNVANMLLWIFIAILGFRLK